MTKQDFISKWNVAYENLEQHYESAVEMSKDLDALIQSEIEAAIIANDYRRINAASSKDLRSGWTLDFKRLQEIQSKAEMVEDESISLEAIESVLNVFLKL